MIHLHKEMTGLMSKDIVLDAMDTPVFNSNEIKEQVSTEFRDKYYLECIRG